MWSHRYTLYATSQGLTEAQAITRDGGSGKYIEWINGQWREFCQAKGLPWRNRPADVHPEFDGWLVVQFKFKGEQHE